MMARGERAADPVDRVRRRRRGSAVAAAAAVCLALTIGSTALATDGGSQTDPGSTESAPTTGPDVDPVADSQLDALRGEEAVQELVDSGTLDDVADDVGMEPDELVDELRDDSSLFLTGDGELGYVDALALGATGPAVAEPLALPLGVSASALSSKPTSSLVIYLDFDGHSTNDPYCGRLYRIRTVRSRWCAGVVLSDGAGGDVRDMAARQSRTTLPFDVNVTTTDPGVEALRKSSSSDAAYGQRMVISPTNFVGSSGVLGVALLNVFASSSDRPAFVFSGRCLDQDHRRSRVARGRPHARAEPRWHGRGRATTTVTASGHRSWDEASRRPPVSQWSRGEYLGANNLEDDLAKIAGYTGYRPDDHGATACTATVVANSSTTGGIIGTTGDRDMFAVDVGAGTLAVTLRPPPGTETWSNLFAQVTIRSSTGEVVATGTAAAPTSWVSATSAVVPAGRYTLEVEPLGWLDASTGFTTYGSLGAYELSVVCRCEHDGTSTGLSLDVHARHTETADRHPQRRRRIRKGRGGSPGRGPGDRRCHRAGGRRRRRPQHRRRESVGPGIPHGLSVLGGRARHVDAQLRRWPDRRQQHDRGPLECRAAVRLDLRRHRHPRRHHRLDRPGRIVAIHADRSDASGRHPLGGRWPPARCGCDDGRRLQRCGVGRLHGGRLERHGGQCLGSGLPHRVPVRRCHPQHLDHQLRRR